MKELQTDKGLTSETSITTTNIGNNKSLKSLILSGDFYHITRNLISISFKKIEANCSTPSIPTNFVKIKL